MMRSNLHYIAFIIGATAVGVLIAWTWVVGCAWLDSLDGRTPFHPGIYWPVTKTLGAVALINGMIALITRNRTPKP